MKWWEIERIVLHLQREPCSPHMGLGERSPRITTNEKKKMKRLFLAMLAGMLIAALPTTAQTEKNRQDQKENFGQRFVRLGKKAVKEMEKAANGLGDAIGFDDRVNPVEDDGDSVRIGGTYYMPLYTTNLYKGSDARIYTDECRKRFKERFPEAEIKSVGLVVYMRLTPFVNEITIKPESLRKMLDSVLQALLHGAS